MRKLIIILIIGIYANISFGQTPQYFNYQAILRNHSGSIIVSQPVNLKVSIHDISAGGTVVFQETHSATTNQFGVVNIKIGDGSQIIGPLSSVPWAIGDKFIEVEIDYPIGSGYISMGTQQLLSVPYALHSKTAESISGGITETDPVFVSSPANGITSTLISDWNASYSWGNHAGLYKPITYVPDWPEITNKPNYSDSINNKAVLLTGNQTIAGNKTFTGTISANSNTIIDVASPLNNTDAVNKAYVDVLQAKIIALENSLVISGAYIKDIDGNLYSTVKIGTQVWMAENLKTTKYSNGDLIGTTTPATLNISAETAPKYQWAYNGSESNVATYGRLYTFYAVTDNRNIAPKGWHVATDAEWTTMENYLMANGYNYDSTFTGNKYAKAMASTAGWAVSTNTGAVGNTDFQSYRNKSGFSAVPGGYRFDDGTFTNIGDHSFWWSSTEYSSTDAWYRLAYYYTSNVDRISYTKSFGFSVRCIKD
jgi:uncharacterized protein (TIGR02145 family)